MDLTLQFQRDYEALERDLKGRAIEVDGLRRRVVELEQEAEARAVAGSERLEREVERLRLRVEQSEREARDWRRRHEDLAREGSDSDLDPTRLELARCRDRLLEVKLALGDSREELRRRLEQAGDGPVME